MKRILFSVLFLLSLALAHSTPEPAFAPTIAGAAQEASQKRNYPQANQEKLLEALLSLPTFSPPLIREEIAPGSTELAATLEEKYGNILPFLEACQAGDEEALAEREKIGALREKANLWKQKQDEAAEPILEAAMQAQHDLLDTPGYKKSYDISYEKIIEGKTRIFWWEEHLIPENITEFNKMLNAVREKNKNARILLAMEPIRRAYEIAFPIQFAQQINRSLTISDFYIPIFQTASDLGMDVIALDDYIIKGNLLFPYYCKVGDTFFPYRGTMEEWIEIGKSPWGINQRNKQWAEYINAVSPYYNIIITFTGRGHYGFKQLLSLTDKQKKSSLDVIFQEEGEDGQKKELKYFLWEEKGRINTLLIDLAPVRDITILNLN